jgi:general secretion pathway protein M
MSTDTAAPFLAGPPQRPPATGLRGEAEAFWRGRAPRERAALAMLAVAVVLVLVWLVGVQPAWRILRAAPAELDALDRQLQQLQATAAEVKSLRSIAPVSSPQAAVALKAATDRLGDHARLSMQGDRASIIFTGIDAEALRAWLTEVRSAARARPTEASLSRAANGYSGSMVVTLGGAP